MSRKFAGALLIFCVAGLVTFLAIRLFFTDPQLKAVPVDLVVQRAVDSSNRHSVDTAVSLLKQGYLVLRMGLGADSRLLAQMGRKNKSYSHCGIVLMEHGYPFVYHAIGGENNPDARLRRDSAKFFFSPVYNLALAVMQYDLDSGRIAGLKDIVLAYYRQRPKFDLKFDLATNDALYCSEFIYKAVNKAADDTAYIQPAILGGRRFVGIDDLFVNRHAHIIWQTVFK